MSFLLETPRLVLREFDLVDAEGFFNMNADPEVMKYTGEAPFLDVGETKNFIENYDHYRQFGYGRWTVLNKKTKAYMGWCGLKNSVEKNEIDLGYRFQKKYWNHGYATEAGRACVELGFSTLKMEKIVGRAKKENVASLRVLEKIGMSFEKNIREDGQAWVQYQVLK